MKAIPAICIMLCAVGPLPAQTTDNGAQNPARVRLLLLAPGSRPLIGVPVTMRADTVRLVLQGTTDTVGVATQALRGIEESRGRRSSWDRGAMIGALVLGIGGAIAVPAFNEAIGDGTATNGGEAVALGLVGGAVTGGLLGAGIGAMFSRERWSARPIVGVRRAAARDRVDLGVALGLAF